jgi:hypothetical protein
MGTGTSRRRLAFAALILAGLTLVLAGCGGSAGGSHSAGTPAGGSSAGPAGGSGGAGTAGGSSGGADSAAFSWLQPQSPPTGWKIATIPGGASMAYPPNWKTQRGDAGTATAALMGTGAETLGYLNLTPRQGAETLADWSSFRLDHNAEEGDKHIHRLAAAQHLRFRSGGGSCVKDAYTTITNARYVEIACLVAGRHGEAVIVAAAPPDAWGREAGTLERAIRGVTT